MEYGLCLTSSSPFSFAPSVFFLDSCLVSALNFNEVAAATFYSKRKKGNSIKQSVNGSNSLLKLQFKKEKMCQGKDSNEQGSDGEKRKKGTLEKNSTINWNI